MAIWQIPIELRPSSSEFNLRDFRSEIEKVLGEDNSPSPSSLHFGKYEWNDLRVFLEQNPLKMRLRIVPGIELLDELTALMKVISKFKLAWFDGDGKKLVHSNDWENLVRNSDAKAFIEDPIGFLKRLSEWNEG